MALQNETNEDILTEDKQGEGIFERSDGDISVEEKYTRVQHHDKIVISKGKKHIKISGEEEKNPENEPKI